MINGEENKVLELLEAGEGHLFVTGRAGTGKSTLLTQFYNGSTKNLVVLAPTGVAAVNIGGTTIHSFFGFKPDITLDKAWDLGSKTKKKKLYQALDAIIIDEISMVRADLMDAIDAFLRRVCNTHQPFGGKRLLLFGDLYQLPPVVTRGEIEIYKSRYATPYFFSADAISRLDLLVVELTKIYRQTDPEFIELLGEIRENKLSEARLALLNTRVAEDYAPPAEEYVVHLTGTNYDSERYNSYQLGSLEGQVYEFGATASGEFEKKGEPAPRELHLKLGAQVMLTANDKDKRFINGTIGRVEDIDTKGELPIVTIKLASGKLIDVTENTWEMYKFGYHQESNRIISEVVGTYTQLPLTLAWSITIHKSQGKTFDKVVIDLPHSFAHGQTYVALSRATALTGIILKRPLSQRHIIFDPTVISWLSEKSKLC